MEPECSSPHSQEPTTCPYLTSYQSISPGPKVSVWTFLNKICFYGEESLEPRRTPKLETTPCRLCRLLLQYICSYPPYCRLFVHLQPEDMPCRGDRDPLITVAKAYTIHNLIWDLTKPLMTKWMVWSVLGVVQQNYNKCCHCLRQRTEPLHSTRGKLSYLAPLGSENISAPRQWKHFRPLFQAVFL